MLTENIVPVFPCRDKANDGDLAGNVLRQSEAGFTSCGVAVKAEEYFSGVLAFRKKTVNERGISSRTMRTAKSRIGDRLVTEKDGTAWVCYLRD